MSPKAHLTTLASKTTDLSGTQKNDVVFMQNVNRLICKQTTSSNIIKYPLTDERVETDGPLIVEKTKHKSYLVMKLTDNNCWMAQNLAVGNNDSSYVLNTVYSNIDYTIPKGDNSSSGFSTNEQESVFIASHKANSEDSSENYGGNYTWCAATAGKCTSYNTAYQKVADNQNLCPKLWKLPAAYSSISADSIGELRNIGRNYDLFSGFLFTYGTGNVIRGTRYNGNSILQIWSANAGSGTSAYLLQMGNTHHDCVSYPDRLCNAGRFNGNSIRCVTTTTE